MQAPAYRIRELGELVGDLLLFGGPYSNLQASQALLAVAKRRNIPAANRICTGDLVAYCAHPNETVELWQQNCQLLAGNCEKQLGAGAADCGCGFQAGSACDRLSGDWFSYASAQLSDRNRAPLADAPDLLTFIHGAKRYAVIHGGVKDISRFLWPVSPDREFQQEISCIQVVAGSVDGVISGHCGMAFHRRIDGVDWINPGVIGMPAHDGVTDTQFAVLDRSGVHFERLSYDFGQAAAAMRRVGLDQGYDSALLSGYWPSQDILPASLRRAPQGASCPVPTDDGSAPDP